MLLQCFVLVAIAPFSVTAFNVAVDSGRKYQDGSNATGFGYAVGLVRPGWLLVASPSNVNRKKVAICKTGKRCQHIRFRRSDDKWYFRVIDKDGNTWSNAKVERRLIITCLSDNVEIGGQQIGTCWPTPNCRNVTDEKETPIRGKILCNTPFNAGFLGSDVFVINTGTWSWEDDYFSKRYNQVKLISKQQAQKRDKKKQIFIAVSSAEGQFDNSAKTGYVLGIPAVNNNTGMIEVYSKNMTKVHSIHGEQVESKFGATVAASDLNGDNLDDIIVAAPFYTNMENATVGRVYIYYTPHMSTDVLTGVSDSSQFGRAVAGIGDINNDGYNDLAVGAPEGGPDGNGVVYIYHGSMRGIITEPMQIIHAADVAKGLSMLGVSIANGFQKEDGSYSGLAIGAKHSVYHFSTRPVIRVSISTNTSPDSIDIAEANCEHENSSRVSCFQVFTCLDYTGIAGEPKRLSFTLTHTIDADLQYDGRDELRAGLVSKPRRRTIIKAVKTKMGHPYCMTVDAYVRARAADEVRSIQVKVEVKLKQPSKSAGKILPMLDPKIPTEVTRPIRIVTDCGFDDVCIPDLFIYARNNTEYRLSSGDVLEASVSIGNLGENTIGTQFHLELPSELLFRSVTSPLLGGDFGGLACSLDQFDKTSLTCAIFKTFPSVSQYDVTFAFHVIGINETDYPDSLDISLYITSEDLESMETLENNKDVLSIPVIPFEEVDMTTDPVTSWTSSQPDTSETLYDSTMFSIPEDINIRMYGDADPNELRIDTNNIGDNDLISYKFLVANDGMYEVKGAVLHVMYPIGDNSAVSVEILGNTTDVQCSTLSNEIRDPIVSLYEEHYNETEGELKCSTQRCAVIRCVVETLPGEGSVDIETNLNISSLLKDDQVREIQGNQYHLVTMALLDYHSEGPPLPTATLQVVTNVEIFSSPITNPVKDKDNSSSTVRYGVGMWIVAILMVLFTLTTHR